MLTKRTWECTSFASMSLLLKYTKYSFYFIIPATPWSPATPSPFPRWTSTPGRRPTTATPPTTNLPPLLTRLTPPPQHLTRRTPPPLPPTVPPPPPIVRPPPHTHASTAGHQLKSNLSFTLSTLANKFIFGWGRFKLVDIFYTF